MSDFSRFDELADLDALREGIEKAESGGAKVFEEIPHDTYEVSIEKMELAESKKGDPMMKAWFRILSGDYEGYLIFMNQVITKPFQIHIVNQFLRSLKTGLDIGFESYGQYAGLVDEVFAEAEKREYALEYGERKGFNTFTIVEVFD